MKKISSLPPPYRKTQVTGGGCCKPSPAMKSHLFPDGGGCCGDLGPGFNFGTQETEADEINWGGYTYSGTCPVTVRFSASMTGFDSDPENKLVVNVMGADHEIFWIETGTPYVDVIITPGDEITVFATIRDDIDDCIVTLSAINLTCDQDLGEVLNWTLNVPPCCALNAAPWFAPASTPLSDYNSVPDYEFLGSCEGEYNIKFTYDQIGADPGIFMEVNLNGSLIPLTHNTDQAITANPGWIFGFFILQGVAVHGTVTLWAQNLTCGTPYEVVGTVEMSVP